MIRRRVAVVLVAGVAVILAVAGALAVSALESRLIGEIDDQIDRRVLDVVRFTNGRVLPQFPDADANRTGPGGRFGGRSPFDVSGAVFVQLDVDGQVVAAITTGPANDPDPLPDLEGFAIDGEPHTVDPVEGSGPRYRVVGIAGDDGALVTGVSLADVDESIESTTQILLTAGVLALLAVAGLASFVIRRGLRPIDDMIGTAERIADGDLSERATIVKPNNEVGHLGIALNTMLDQISEAVDAKTASESRLRRFVADASHELRTPLTSIRGYAELYRSGEHDEQASERSMHRIEQEAIRMGVLVDDLLLLARFDQGRPLENSRVDLVPLVGAAVDDARVVEPDRVIDLDLTTEDAVVVGDEHRLGQVVGNLLGNVRAHAGAGTPARVELSADAEFVAIVVADEGAGMTTEQVDQAFERFWQADPSGGSGRRGTGLGLAIVAEIVDAHGGTIELDSAPGDGTTVSVRLPRTPTG
jgi:two-component system OmpR family sensor kinase